MENASKALIMAAGILISIMVISFMIFVLRKAGSMSAQYDQQIAENELTKFNGQFEVYAKEDNTFFDVLTVANLAWDVNKKNNWDEQTGVTIKIINENNDNMVEYSILPNQSLKRDYFFVGEDVTRPVYIYNEAQSNLENKSIIDYYTQRKQPNNEEYIYRFNCQKITYNDITGKVKEMSFKIVKNL